MWVTSPRGNHLPSSPVNAFTNAVRFPLGCRHTPQERQCEESDSPTGLPVLPQDHSFLAQNRSATQLTASEQNNGARSHSGLSSGSKAISEKGKVPVSVARLSRTQTGTPFARSSRTANVDSEFRRTNSLLEKRSHRVSGRRRFSRQRSAAAACSSGGDRKAGHVANGTCSSSINGLTYRTTCVHIRESP